MLRLSTLRERERETNAVTKEIFFRVYLLDYGAL